jgi:hypothetical protein
VVSKVVNINRKNNKTKADSLIFILLLKKLGGGSRVNLSTGVKILRQYAS